MQAAEQAKAGRGDGAGHRLMTAAPVSQRAGGSFRECEAGRPGLCSANLETEW